MGFNLMSFLGGAALGGEEILDENRAYAKQKELTAEERKWQIATEDRADARTRRAKRDAKTKSVGEFTAQLNSLGYDEKSITSILAGGAKNVATWKDIGLQHKKSGKEFNVNLLLRDAIPTDPNVQSSALKDVSPPPKISTISTQKDAWTEYNTPMDPVFKDLNQEFAYYSSKANDAKGDKKDRFQQQADNALNSLKVKAKALEDEGETVSSIYNKSTMTTLTKDNIKLGLESVEFSTDRETGMITRAEGDLGRHAIGTLNGIALTKEFNTNEKGEVEDFNFAKQLNLAEKQQYNNLNQHAQKAVGRQEGYVTQFKTEEILHEKLNLGPVPMVEVVQDDGSTKLESESGGYISQEILSSALNSGSFTFGDVVQVRGKDGIKRIVVYTGFEEGNFYTAFSFENEE